MNHLAEIKGWLEELSMAEALHQITTLFPGRVKFSSSLGQEDQVLTDIIARNRIPIQIFTLDTGRLFPETYDTIEKTSARYSIPIEVFFPQAEAVQQMVSERGVNLFYDSVENRKLCCEVRKVEPLNRALKGAAVWVTGLRASQTDHRKNIPVAEWLDDKEMYKINPLLHWSYSEVLNYIREFSVPYNPLHDKGFISIGCAPCTRSIEEWEDPRAGRWWWESSQKECGLHVVKSNQP